MGASSSAALGRRSTARDVLAHFPAEAASLAGKTALVTGAASGLGLETVKALTSAGCRVLATARDVAAGERAIAAELAGGAGAATPYAGRADLVKVLPLDLASLASVRALAGALAAEAPLDYVILNAGIMALEKREETAAGFEKQLGVNHFAHHLLVSLLRPRLVARVAPARVIYLSSLAHKSGSVDVANLHFAPPRKYVPWVAYGQSKFRGSCTPAVHRGHSRHSQQRAGRNSGVDRAARAVVRPARAERARAIAVRALAERGQVCERGGGCARARVRRAPDDHVRVAVRQGESLHPSASAGRSRQTRRGLYWRWPSQMHSTGPCTAPRTARLRPNDKKFSAQPSTLKDGSQLRKASRLPTAASLRQGTAQISM